MAKVQLYDILGGDEAHAVSIWPRSRVKSTLGFSASDDPLRLLKYLNSALEFSALRPGASADQVGLIADVAVKSDSADPSALPLVITQMPDVAFYLVKTPKNSPARLYATYSSSTGVELVIEGLPVEIQLPAGLIEALVPPGTPLTNPFRTGDTPRDSLYVQPGGVMPTSIFVFVRVRMTEELDFVIEPAVPISIGPCRFLGIPCRGLHDINLVPSPHLQGNHSIREQALEWTRHKIDRLQPDARYGGLLTVRTVDMDTTVTPLKDLLQRMHANALVSKQNAEFVLEDVALPFFNLAMLPIPSHGLFGLRRQIKAGDDPAEAFALAGAPLNQKIPFFSERFTLLVDQLLLQTPAKEDDDQFIFVQMAVYRSDSPPDKAQMVTIGVADDWTLQLGYRQTQGKSVFQLFGVEVKIFGFKVGFSFKRMAAKTSFGDMIQLLFDFGVSVVDTPFLYTSPFQIRSLSGKDLTFALHDVGWNLGQFSLDGLTFPEGVQIIAFGPSISIRLIIDDMGWVTENNGGRYFSFSGGILLFGLGSPKASPSRKDVQDSDRGSGFRFHRLRGRVGGNSNAPDWLLDGITLSVEVGNFQIKGTGMISEFSLDGTDYKEFGLALLVSFDLFAKHLILGMALFYGTARGKQDFTYWMFGFEFSPIPMYLFELLNVRMLLAGNVVPDLDNFQDDGYAQNMRLFRWYRAHQSAITLPDNRKLGSWKRQDHSFAMGIGAAVSLPVGDLVILDMFVFYEKTPQDKELLIALEAFLLGSSDPIGYGALELDLNSGTIGFMLGVTLTVAQVVKIKLPDFLKRIFALTGSLYVTNRPATFAIGQLTDQSTWLSFRLDTRIPLLGGGKLEVALCVQTVDAPGGPSGFGFLFAAAGSQPFGFGLVEFYASLAMMAGIWRNESTVSGFLMQIEAGLRIRVFWVFNFGINVRIDFHWLGHSPAYRALDVQFRIETPWWLPDVTVHFSRHWDTAQPSQMKAISPPLKASGSLKPGHPPALKLQTEAPSDTRPDVLITFLPNQEQDEHALYHMDDLRALDNLSLPDSDLDRLQALSVDSVIGLNFKASVDDRTSTGENTPAGASTQQSNDLSVTYEVVALGIRRRPRFGPGAGTWTMLLAPEDTRYKSPSEFPAGSDIEAHYTSVVSYHWDRDMVRSGQLDPRRLLINADTPYSFLAKNPEGDENTARNDPGWPCSTPGRGGIPWHILNFQPLPFGAQPPSYMAFSESKSTLHFIGSTQAVVTPGTPSPTTHVARLFFSWNSGGTFAIVSFAQPAAFFEANLYWAGSAWTNGGFLVIEVYRGLKSVHREIINPAMTGPSPFSWSDSEGMTSIVFRFDTGGSFLVRLAGTPWIELVNMGYYTVEDVANQFNKTNKTDARKKRALSGSGKLAWLPNHDYEISLDTRVTLAHKSSGQQQAEVQQKAYFRTKGLPGLNAVDRIGDELEPFLESRYPDALPATTLYRAEPVMLTFNENFNTLWPVDRAPAPTDPNELQQVLAWVLAIDKPGYTGGKAERVSQTSPDWIVLNRKSIVSLPFRSRVARLSNEVVSSKTRVANTLDPMKQRFENMLQRPDACLDEPPAHPSRVLIHAPVDLEGGTLWEPNVLYRANLRMQDGPFVERDPFEEPDASAFDIGKDGSPDSSSWDVHDGALHATLSVIHGTFGTILTGGTAHHFAVFGETSWNHVQVHTTLDPQGHIAGVAVGVELQGTQIKRAVMALIDEHSGKTLRLLELRDGITREIASKSLPAQASVPYALEVIAYDDQIRANVSGVTIQATRDDVRDGRLALVTRLGGATFMRLVVESLDANRFQFTSSRFSSFVEHIQSIDNTVTAISSSPLGGALSSVSSLFAAPQIAAVMTPDADPEQRQRVFDQWVSGLALPLRRRLDGLHLSTFTGTNGITVLLLEGPEPLTLSNDVTLKIFQRVLTSFPLYAHPALAGSHLSQKMLDWAAGLSLSNDSVAGFIPAHLTADVAATSELVIALPAPTGADYHVYTATIQPGPQGTAALSSTLKEIVQPQLGSHPNPNPLLKKIADVRSNHMALIDGAGNVSHIIPINPHNMVRFVSVPVSILTNGKETQALIIPVDATGTKSIPLASGIYRFDFSIDRVRYRQLVPDNTSNYRMQASFTRSL